jgi:nitrite reductase/ring-hydroxylating ferredoxin subunit/uncharacterized membrane protein
MPTVDLLLSTLVNDTIGQAPILKQAGTAVKKALHRAFLSSAETRSLADLLHGTWLGHPLHPILTDITIGAWTFGTLFDLLSRGSASRRQRRQAEDAADMLMTVGVASAIPTAIAGLTDFSTIKEEAAPVGALHGSLNVVALLLYLGSVLARRRGDRQTGVALALVGMTLATFTAWLGGEMVYRKRVAVNHAEQPTEPTLWTAVLPEADLIEAKPRRVEVEGKPVLLYRRGGTVYALVATCSHAGGPLDEGTFYAGCVQCPWHDSVFDLSDGHIVHGPATTPQPTYRVRIENGRIEIRAELAAPPALLAEEANAERLRNWNVWTF